jgi:hypothetical protein
MNHWLPSLVKNLDPLVVIVGSETARAARFNSRKKNMVSQTVEDEETRDERNDFAAVDERRAMAITGSSPI